MRICFVMGGVFGGSSVGGAERQIARIAEGLAARGHTICLVARASEARATAEAWRFGPVGYYDDTGPTRLSWLPAIEREVRAMRPDVVYQRGLSVFTTAAAAASHAGGFGFVFACASDVEADGVVDRIGRAYRRRESGGGRLRRIVAAVRDGWTHGRFLKSARAAHVVLVQSEWQRDALAARLALPSSRFRIVASATPEPGPVWDGARDAVVWVGADKAVKRPERFVEIAGRGPADLRYVMVGTGIGALGYAHRAGVETHDALPPERIIELMSRAVAVVNTSEAEGFPNTFLEAWSVGTPVLTLGVDPDGMVAREGLGWVCDEAAEAGRILASLIGAPEKLVATQARCRAYFEMLRARDDTVDKVERALHDAAALVPKAGVS